MALEEWCHYLLPLHFIARTDHNGLKYLCTPGKQMAVPDSLSRKPKTETDFENLLRMQKHPDDEPFMEIKVKNKAGKTE
eukprot:3935818-Rhodomonas_salina.5